MKSRLTSSLAQHAPIFALFAVALFFALAAYAQERTRPISQTQVLAEAFGSVDRDAGWCDYATTSATDIWASSNVPTELLSSDSNGAVNRGNIRFLTVRIVDQQSANASLPVCLRLGPNTGSSRTGLTCVGTPGSEQTNGAFILATKEGRKWQTERIAPGTHAFILASSVGTGSGIRYCVEVEWHQGG